MDAWKNEAVKFEIINPGAISAKNPRGIIGGVTSNPIGSLNPK